MVQLNPNDHTPVDGCHAYPPQPTYPPECGRPPGPSPTETFTGTVPAPCDELCLPATGADAGPLAWLGVAIVLVGAVLLIIVSTKEPRP